MIPSDADLQEAIDRAAAMGMMSIDAEAEFMLAAMATAWDMAERAIGTNILATGTDCEAYDRPTGWVDHSERFALLELRKTDLVSIDTVTITHDRFLCDCEDEDVSGCAHIHNERFAHIRVEDCAGPAACSCSTQGRPTQVEICYTAGKWGTVAAIPRPVILALGLAATYWLDVMDTGGEAASSAFIDSWRSMDYSESRGFITKNVMGTHPKLAQAWQILRRHRIMRAPVARGYYHSQPPRGL